MLNPLVELNLLLHHATFTFGILRPMQPLFWVLLWLLTRLPLAPGPSRQKISDESRLHSFGSLSSGARVVLVAPAHPTTPRPSARCVIVVSAFVGGRSECGGAGCRGRHMEAQVRQPRHDCSKSGQRQPWSSPSPDLGGPYNACVVHYCRYLLLRDMLVCSAQPTSGTRVRGGGM